jgi:hypothetical protein
MFLNASDRAPSSNEMKDEENHEQNQQDVDERHGYVESDKSEKPCNEEQYRECEKHVRNPSFRSVFRQAPSRWM